MAYTIPRLLVHQEFEPVLDGATDPLYACVVAPHYGLHRFAQSDEKASLGAYDADNGNSYSAYPDKTAGGVVDLAYNRMFIEDAILKYHQFNMPGATDGATEDDGNKIRSSSLIFKTANGSSRSAAFGTRDVTLGDYVKVTWNGGSDVVETTVAGLIADVVDSVISALTEASGNTAAQATDVETIDSQTFASDVISAIDVDASSYDGLADGHARETYTCTVISTDGTVTGTLFRAISTSGTDDVLSSSLAAMRSPTTVGTRGATVTLDDANVSSSSSSSKSSSSNSSSSRSVTESSTSESSVSPSESSTSESSVSPSESSTSESSQSSSPSSESSISRSESSVATSVVPAVGDTWTITVGQAYAKPTPTSNAGDDYTGSSDTSYVVRILQGGVIGTDTVKFDVYTTTGIDSAPSRDVETAGAYPVGNGGVEVTFNAGEQYVTGDEFVIAVTAAGSGPMRTIALADSLTGALTSDDLSVTLGLEDAIELADAYWTAAAASISVSAGASVTASYLGVEASFDILSGDLYIHYRELLQTNVSTLSYLDEISAVSDTLGPSVADNPISLLVYKALQNSEGTPVYYLGLTTNNQVGYARALEVLSVNENPYGIVPYDESDSVKELIKAHVVNMSSAEKGMWRVAWLSANEAAATARYVALADESEILATVSDIGGGLFRQVDASSALFITNGVQAGDELRINYTTDAFGDESWDAYEIDSVDSEGRLTLATGPSAAVGVAIKIEVWRNANDVEYAQKVAAVATGLNHRRVRAVWADAIYDGSHSSLPMSALCAALAGLRSGVAPHQPLTNVEVSGIMVGNDMALSASNMDVMAEAGIWIVVKNIDGEIYTRHQLTTDNDDINMREDTVTSNVDHMSRDFRDSLSDLYGRGNVSDEMIELIRSRVNARASQIASRSYADTIGPQLQDFEISRLERDEVLRDKLVIEVLPELPYPLNNLDMYIRIIA